jgi:hypothetical protein
VENLQQERHFSSSYASLDHSMKQADKIKNFPYLVPWMSFDLRESKFSVVRVHTSDLLACWSTKNLPPKQIRSIHGN